MKNKNVIIDTNIIVSVLLTKNSESSTYKVLELVFNKTIKPFIIPGSNTFSSPITMMIKTFTANFTIITMSRKFS